MCKRKAGEKSKVECDQATMQGGGRKYRQTSVLQSLQSRTRYFSRLQPVPERSHPGISQRRGADDQRGQFVLRAGCEGTYTVFRYTVFNRDAKRCTLYETVSPSLHHREKSANMAWSSEHLTNTRFNCFDHSRRLCKRRSRRTHGRLHLEAFEQGDGLHGLAQAHLVPDQRAAPVPQGKANALPLEL